MRTNKIQNYESILQVLGEGGCPFCHFMKNFQSAVLQDPDEKEIHYLCNFHAWGLAAKQGGSSAAQLFLNLLAKGPEASASSTCDICVLLEREEQRRIREFVSCLNHKLVVQWLRSQANLCIAHGAKLKQNVSPVVASTISTVMERYRVRLTEDLNRLRTGHQPGSPDWGVLGHVAEFLVSQRGLRP